MAGNRGRKKGVNKTCRCVNCNQSKPYDDNSPGLVCDRLKEACIGDCANCESWSCSYEQDHPVLRVPVRNFMDVLKILAEQ